MLLITIRICVWATERRFRHSPVTRFVGSSDGTRIARCLARSFWCVGCLSLDYLSVSWCFHALLCPARVIAVCLSVTISRPFDWVDLPPLRSPDYFSPGVDFVILAGYPQGTGAFLGAFPFQRFPNVEAIVRRLSVKLIVGHSGEEVLLSVRVEDLRVNPIYARGYFVATIIETTSPTGRFIDPPFQEDWFVPRRRR